MSTPEHHSGMEGGEKSHPLSHALSIIRRRFVRAKDRFPLLSRTAAAIEIQRCYRGASVRKRRLFLRRRARLGISIPHEEAPLTEEAQENILHVFDIAAFTIQQAWKKYRRRVPKNYRFMTKQDRAAWQIQRWWHSVLDRKIYTFYRDLIKFRERGDPSIMLRCINPVEAQLVESATSLYVRFRLGGQTFPPTIYYKIFTSRGLVDLNAFAPRDYVAQRHGDEGSGWYCREDYNNWRSIADTVLQNAEDIIMQMDEKEKKKMKRYTYHPDQYQRKEDIERRRKRQKVRWLMEMYKDGMTTEKMERKGGDGDTAQKLYDALETNFEEFEKEADDLLEWSKQLDFDEYQKAWAETAVTFGGMQYDSDEDDTGKEVQDDFSLDRMTSTPFGSSDMWGLQQDVGSESLKKMAKFTESSENLKLDMKSMENE